MDIRTAAHHRPPLHAVTVLQVHEPAPTMVLDGDLGIIDIIMGFKSTYLMGYSSARPEFGMQSRTDTIQYDASAGQQAVHGNAAAAAAPCALG